MARVALDTGVLIAGMQHGLRGLGDTDDLAVPALVVAEFLAGVVLDHDGTRAEANRAFLAELLAAVPVLDYTSAVAEHHADLLAHTRRTGSPRGAHDLIIAATARAAARAVATTDRRAGFNTLPDVACIVVPGPDLP